MQPDSHAVGGEGITGAAASGAAARFATQTRTSGVGRTLFIGTVPSGGCARSGKHFLAAELSLQIYIVFEILYLSGKYFECRKSVHIIQKMKKVLFFVETKAGWEEQLSTVKTR